MATNQQARHETVFDDVTRRLARTYAEALYNAAAQEGEGPATPDGGAGPPTSHQAAGPARGQTALVLEELEGLVGEVFRRDPQLEEFLSSPAVTRDRKGEVLRKAFQGRVSDTTLHFLLVLNDHERLDVLRATAAAYRELYEERSGRMKVLVRSAVPLDEDQQERLRQQLRQAYRREPVLQTRVDPDLLGGLVVRVGDWVYDSSVRTRLEMIRDQLIERSSHEIQSGRDRFCS